jgi:hypothetical protein
MKKQKQKNTQAPEVPAADSASKNPNDELLKAINKMTMTFEGLSDLLSPPESFDVSSESIFEEYENPKLWQLYLARVAKAETINTMRRDIRVIFREALDEAQYALEVWNKKMEG